MTKPRSGNHSTIPVSEIVTQLAARSENLCRHLLPGGHREGAEWIEASRKNGGRGDSLRVHLTGVKAGIWSHFAPAIGGDALDLVEYLVCDGDKGRAVRWALVHILITACGAALLGRQQYFIRHAAAIAWESPQENPFDYHISTMSTVRLLRWYGLNVSAWIVALALIPALGALLSVGIPFRHRATRYGGVKLSLYLTAVIPVILAIGWLYHLPIHPLLTQLAVLGDIQLPSSLPSPLTKVSLSAACFAVWWAIGVSGNPFNRRRGWRPIIVNLGLFVAAWLLITRILFPAGQLGELL